MYLGDVLQQPNLQWLPLCQSDTRGKDEAGKYMSILPRTAPSNIEGGIEQRKKRIQVNDPVAIREEGFEQYNKGDYNSAFELFSKAVKLGDADAHAGLADMYHNGKGVEKDKEKELYHLEEAAIGGNPTCRYHLGYYERNKERAVKHWAIAAAQGDDRSTKMLMDAFKDGDISKMDLAAALRAHQAAVDATKSPQREEAEEFERRFNFRSHCNHSADIAP